MRTIRIKLYKFSELSKDAQNIALGNQIKFEQEVMTEDSPFYPIINDHHYAFFGVALFDTPKYRQLLIDTIEANEYEFTENGEIIRKSIKHYLPQHTSYRRLKI